MENTQSGATGDGQETAVPEPLTKGEAAKLVKREVPLRDKEGKLVLGKDSKPSGKTQLVDIAAEEVLSVTEFDDGRVGVVTVDGQKLYGSK